VTTSDRTERPLVTFVIPVRNDRERLCRCIQSIRRNEYPADRLEIVVADNGSADGSDRVAREAGATVLALRDMTVSELRNVAARSAHGQILAFVDADHEIVENWIGCAVERLSSPNVGAVGALCECPHDGTWVQHTYDALRSRHRGSVAVEWLGSGNLAVRREVFERLGGFDATLETCEDVDLCFRLRREGWLLMSDDRLRNVHYGDPKTLKALFKAELWRGRDNLRVSLRSLSLRGSPSIAIPFVDLALMAVAAAGVMTAPWRGLRMTAIALATVCALSGVRASRMMRRLPTKPRAAAKAFAVAVVYDVARALALVVRSRHHRPVWVPRSASPKKPTPA
jgi:glycosyltransferase involved in cell wall biosynthesis